MPERSSPGEIEHYAHSFIQLALELEQTLKGKSKPQYYPSPEQIVRCAGILLWIRDRRLQYFEKQIFDEEGWHIIVDIFIQEKIGKFISVSSVCAGSSLSTTTALRRIKILIEEGYILRENDLTDGRRTFLKLTDKARELVTNFLTDILCRFNDRNSLLMSIDQIRP